VHAFIQRHPDFAVLPLADAWSPANAPAGGGPFLSLTPLRHDTDGFFGAVLVRAKPAAVPVAPAP
jgi:16S rRNA (cytosine967-C5)-methyltransferase